MPLFSMQWQLIPAVPLSLQEEEKGSLKSGT